MINQKYLHKIMPSSGRSCAALRLRFTILASVFNKRYAYWQERGPDTDWFIRADIRGVNSYLWEWGDGRPI
jgi:hypothetical protein